MKKDESPCFSSFLILEGTYFVLGDEVLKISLPCESDVASIGFIENATECLH